MQEILYQRLVKTQWQRLFVCLFVVANSRHIHKHEITVFCINISANADAAL